MIEVSLFQNWRSNGPISFDVLQSSRLMLITPPLAVGGRRIYKQIRKSFELVSPRLVHSSVFCEIGFHLLAVGRCEVPRADSSIHRIVHLASAVLRRRVEA
jgi:hypothetical protein